MSVTMSWLAINDPLFGTSRMVTWTGKSRRVIVTGIEGVDLGSVPCSFELPAAAVVHEIPRDADPVGLARQLNGVIFTVFADWPA